MTGIDDIVSHRKMEEIAVEFFNGFTKRTVGSGAVKPKSSLIVTSNQSFAASPRFVSYIYTCGPASFIRHIITT